MAWQVLTRGIWTGLDWAASASRNSSDPYLIWADLTGFAGMGGLPAGPARVIVELVAGTGPAALEASLAAANVGSVNPLYTGFADAAPRFCTASVNGRFFDAWRDFGIRRYALCVPRATDVRRLPYFEKLMYVRAPRRALIGVIDDGLPYLHERYRSAGKTRVIGFWDQGREVFLDGAAIDQRLGKFDRSMSDQYNEARIYQRDGYARLLRRMETHGAGVLDLAAGGTAHEIACVQFPRETVADSSGGSLAAQALDACHYILSQAKPGQPVVINLSYGGYAGPHDGSGFLEAALDDLSAFRSHDFAVVLAAGNAYNSECHAKVDIPAGGSGQLCWEVPDNDATESFLEIWGPAASGHPGVRVAVTPYKSARGDEVSPGEARIAQSAGVGPWCLVTNAVAPGNGRHQVLVALGPTKRSGSVARELAPSGPWIIEITNLGAALTVDVWIERDGPVGYFDLGGKQSRFKDSQRQGYIDSGATLSSVASGAAVVVVGAYVKSTGEMSSYSSAGGGVRAGLRAGPDVAAPGDESRAKDGLRVATTRSGQDRFRMNGTSAAAPQVARLIADFLASESAPVANADIKAWLASKAQRDDAHYRTGEGSAAPPERAGAGRIKTDS